MMTEPATAVLAEPPWFDVAGRIRRSWARLLVTLENAGEPSRDWAIAATIWLLVALGLLSFLEWPVHGDANTHLVGIHQAVKSNLGLGEAWTFRGPVYSAFLMGLYHLASLFAPFIDVIGFGVAIKAVHLTLVVSCALAAGSGISRRVSGLTGRGGLMSGLFLLAYLSSTYVFWLHAEDVGLLILLACAALGTGRTRVSLLLAGALASALPLLKGVTAALCMPALLIALVGRDRPWRTLVTWGVGFSLGAGVQVYLFAWLWPLPLRDLFETALFQGAAAPEWPKRFARARVLWPTYLLGTPLVGAALCTLAPVLAQGLVRRRFAETALTGAAWLAPALMVIAQDKYFHYHFGAIAFGAAITLARYLATPPAEWSRAAGAASLLGSLCLIEATDHPFFLDQPILRWTLLAGSWVVTLSTWLARPWLARPWLAGPSSVRSWLAEPWLAGPRLAGSCLARCLPVWSRLGSLTPCILGMCFLPAWFKGTDGLSVEKGQARSQSSQRAAPLYRYQEQLHDIAGKEVLTLAYGNAFRALDITPACRHSTPIPVQRFRRAAAEAFEKTPGFIENRACIFDYEGEFVLLQPSWMRRSDMYDEIVRGPLARYRRIAFLGRGRKLELWQRELEPVRKKDKSKDKKRKRTKGQKGRST